MTYRPAYNLSTLPLNVFIKVTLSLLMLGKPTVITTNGNRTVVKMEDSTWTILETCTTKEPHLRPIVTGIRMFNQGPEVGYLWYIL